MKLKNKVAIITGAGRGIGKAIALAFAKEGADIVAAARTLLEIKDTAKEVQSIGRQAIAIKTDVSRKEDVDRLIKLTLKEFGRIDILVNDAGELGPIGILTKNNIDEWIETIHINLIGTFLCTKAVLPTMIKQRKGKVINFSGGGATAPRPYLSSYSTSKAAVVRFTETIAEEVKEFNIQVNAIAPGAVNTRLLDKILKAGKSAGKNELARAKTQKENGGDPPQKAADLAVFLASDDSGSLTGRLISAVWDDWRNLDKEKIKNIISKQLYTLRRIDNIFYCPKRKS